jgi:uncharacterized FlaG/YvyC family protein
MRWLTILQAGSPIFWSSRLRKNATGSQPLSHAVNNNNWFIKEDAMSLNTGEIQPVASGPWVPQEADKKEVKVIAPVAKTEGGNTAKVGEDRTQGGNPGSLPQGFTDEVLEQLKTMLGENTSLEFQVDGNGKTKIKVFDKKTGEVIRQIPAESTVMIQQKLEELRGILFDDKV